MDPYERSGLLSGLLDLSFERFLTPRLIRLLYGLGAASAALVALLMVGMGLSGSAPVFLALLVGAVLFFFSALLFIRIALESAMIFFRISEHTAEMAEHGAEIALNTGGRGSPTRSSSSDGSLV